MVLFIAVPEMLQDGRGWEAGADEEGAAGQHFEGLQERRNGRTPAAEVVKGCKFTNKIHLECIVHEAQQQTLVNLGRPKHRFLNNTTRS